MTIYDYLFALNEKLKPQPQEKKKVWYRANELRSGNWILINNEERPPYYYQITAHDIEEIEGCGEDAFAIDLTPDKLEKAGFVEGSDGYIYIGGFPFMLMFLSDILYMDIEGQLMPVPHCKYLHQLQNLYFALTGEELEISL